MKRTWRSLIGAIAIALAGWQSGSAEEISLKPNFEPFQKQAESTTFSSPEISLVSRNGDCTDGVPTCTPQSCGPSRQVGRDFLVCSNRCCGIIGGLDFLLLKPYASVGLFDNGAGSGQLNFNPAYRMWIGYQGSEGLGGRIRFFDFDRSSPGTPSLGVQFRTFDAELTQAVDFRAWNFLFSGGLRYAQTSVDFSSNPAVLIPGGPISFGFDGIGLTTSAQATRKLNQRGSWQFVAGTRWSALYGNSKGSGTAAGQVRDDLVSVLELNLGPQYRRRLNNGAYLTLGGGLEAQHWSNPIVLPGFDVGFVGFSSTVAITR